MKKTFRVDAFIVPILNRESTTASLKTDDEKCSLKNDGKDKSSDENRTEELCETFRNNLTLFCEGIKLNEDNDEDNDKRSKEYHKRFETAEFPGYRHSKKKSKHLMRSSSLTSINERGETPEDCNQDICYHGYKNGCTVSKQQPQAITEQVFEINWMKRLEELRVKEAAIKDKENILFERERLLFKKERELRILERLVKEKLKHLNNSEESVNKITKQSESFFKDINMRRTSTLNKNLKSHHLHHQHQHHQHKIDKVHDNDELTTDSDHLKINRAIESNSCDGKSSSNSTNSRNSLIFENILSFDPSKIQKSQSDVTNWISKSAFSDLPTYDSVKYKPRPKINYEDLDSTLSADIGDSSFIVTSKKIDLNALKRPYLSRSASDRRPKSMSDCKQLMNNQNIGIAGDDKVLKRMSQNIIYSQDGIATFQNYGLIDTKKNSNGFDKNIVIDKQNKDIKKLTEMPKKILFKDQTTTTTMMKTTSTTANGWSAEADKWLQKKRQDYNNLQTAQKKSNENIVENKENQSKSTWLQRKTSKRKKFGAFN